MGWYQVINEKHRQSRVTLGYFEESQFRFAKESNNYVNIIY